METNAKMVVKSASKQQSRVSEIFFKKSMELFFKYTASSLQMVICKNKQTTFNLYEKWEALQKIGFQ